MYMKVRKKYESISSKRKRNQLKPNKCKFLKRKKVKIQLPSRVWLRPNIIQICIIPQVDGYVNMIDDSLSHKHIGYYKPVNE